MARLAEEEIEAIRRWAEQHNAPGIKLLLAELRRLFEIEQKYEALKECRRQAQAWYVRANLEEP